MRRFLILAARLAIGAWCGAAIMFVITTVQEVRSPQFDSVTKARLAVLRFPTYYKFAFACIPVATAAAAAAGMCRGPMRARLGLSAVLLIVASGLTVYDYVYVYQDLEAITADFRSARPPRFDTLHRQSRTINAINVGLCLLGSVLLCWPGGTATVPDSSQTGERRAVP